MWLLFAVLAAFEATACGGRWRPQHASDVAGMSDPNATYAVVLDTLKAQKYQVVSQDAPSHTVSVRAHVGERDSEGGSVIHLHVGGSSVHVSATGYLVHRDGSTHRTLNAELAALEKQLNRGLGSGVAPTISAAPPGAPTGDLPVAWSEPAYDPAV
ncbi:MAG: hypothetical protein ABIQ16_06535, partial [Polyangiaceae bacterium]